MAYSLLENFDDIIKQHIAPYLKKHGFKKQNLNFYKTEGDVKCSAPHRLDTCY
jgi:Fe-S cluster biogenesis protein NfuA